MLYLLLGQDTFTKSQFIKDFAGKQGVIPKALPPDQIETAALGTSGGDLFGTLNIFTFTEPALDTLQERVMEQIKVSKDVYFFLTDSLDMRKKVNKEILSDKHIKNIKFDIPEGTDLKNWTKDYLKEKNKTIDNQAYDLLISRLGLGLNLWQLSGELDKLCLFVQKSSIAPRDVEVLVVESTEVEIFDLVNALAQKNKKLLADLLEKFYSDSTTSDEKSKTIQLAALLSEQLRSLLLVKSAQSQRLPDQELVTLTGWKPARVSVVKRTASIFSTQTLTESLNKFTHLDMELKTSNTPPRVLLDLILAQIVST